MANKKTQNALAINSALLTLLDEVESMPVPVVSEFSTIEGQKTLIETMLGLIKRSRTAGDTFYGRKGFTAAEIVKALPNPDGKELTAYEVQQISEDVNTAIGFELGDDKKQKPAAEGTLLALGLVETVERGGNRGRGQAFTLNLTKVREFFEVNAPSSAK